MLPSHYSKVCVISLLWFVTNDSILYTSCCLSPHLKVSRLQVTNILFSFTLTQTYIWGTIHNNYNMNYYYVYYHGNSFLLKLSILRGGKRSRLRVRVCRVPVSACGVLTVRACDRVCVVLTVRACDRYCPCLWALMVQRLSHHIHEHKQLPYAIWPRSLSLSNNMLNATNANSFMSCAVEEEV